MTQDDPLVMFVHGVLFVLALGLYFTPWIVARLRGHHQSLAIGILNLLGGWTVAGWVASLVWACTVVRRADQR